MLLLHNLWAYCLCKVPDNYMYPTLEPPSLQQHLPFFNTIPTRQAQNSMSQPQQNNKDINDSMADLHINKDYADTNTTDASANANVRLFNHPNPPPPLLQK
jgi:hypothetical protein